MDQDNRRKDGVDAKTFSNLKCIYSKLRDSADTQNAIDSFKITKFEENKFKNVKRNSEVEHIDNISF